MLIERHFIPLYLFSNPDNENDIVEVVMSVNDVHEYTKDNIKWNRVWQKPQMNTDTKVDPFSRKDYIRATGKGKDTIGGLMDRSKELGMKREDKMGRDSVKEIYYSQYSKARNGRQHPEQRKERLAKILKEPIEMKVK